MVFIHELPRSNRHYGGAVEALTFRDGSFCGLRIIGLWAVYGAARAAHVSPVESPSILRRLVGQ